MDLILRTPKTEEFKQIHHYIREFELDNRDLHLQQFIAAFRNNELVGFGRLRKHIDCIELCSLGVVTPLRRKGIGKAIVNELIKQVSDTIYLVCIIPEFFSPFNFVITTKYPSSICDKLNYCSSELTVPETYVVMELKSRIVP
jgi:N-acetylglutamate synthase-like GNAT family acetyltransferase